jgi:hypothetical protein
MANRTGMIGVDLPTNHDVAAFWALKIWIQSGGRLPSRFIIHGQVPWARMMREMGVVSESRPC